MCLILCGLSLYTCLGEYACCWSGLPQRRRCKVEAERMLTMLL